MALAEKIAKTGEGVKDLAVGAGLVVGLGMALYVGWKIVRATAAAGDAVSGAVAAVKETVTRDLNPASSDNLGYRGVNALGAALTGEKEFSLGSKIYDWFH